MSTLVSPLERWADEDPDERFFEMTRYDAGRWKGTLYLARQDRHPLKDSVGSLDATGVSWLTLVREMVRLAGEVRRS